MIWFEFDDFDWTAEELAHSFKAMLKISVLNIITKAIVSTGNSVSQPSLHHCQKFIKLNSAHKKIHNLF